MGKLRVKRRNHESISKSKLKKSTRLMMQNYKKKLHKRAKNNFKWPRTVEAAKDPFIDHSGKNKMFFVIAINLYPTSKIVQPSDTESESDEENVCEETAYEGSSSTRLQNGSFVSSSIPGYSHDLTRRRHPSRSLKGKRRRRNNYDEANDGPWRNQRRHRPISTNNRRKLRLLDESVIEDVISTVIQRYQVKDFIVNAPLLPPVQLEERILQPPPFYELPMPIPLPLPRIENTMDKKVSVFNHNATIDEDSVTSSAEEPPESENDEPEYVIVKGERSLQEDESSSSDD